jgi:hypothetical protein
MKYSIMFDRRLWAIFAQFWWFGGRRLEERWKIHTKNKENREFCDHSRVRIFCV